MAALRFSLPDGTTKTGTQQGRCKGSSCFGLFAFLVSWPDAIVLCDEALERLPAVEILLRNHHLTAEKPAKILDRAIIEIKPSASQISASVVGMKPEINLLPIAELEDSDLAIGVR